MFRTMLKSKIHRATVTQADLHYVGSVTVDQELMQAAGPVKIGRSLRVRPADLDSHLEALRDESQTVIPSRRSRTG